MKNAPHLTLVLCVTVFMACVVSSGAAAAPKDSPVYEGGEGPTGNDWRDYYGWQKLRFRDSGGNHHVWTRAVRIDASNGNFTESHAESDSESLASHVHFEDDYGDTSYPSTSEGNAYWDWFYRGHTPEIERLSSCTVIRNCVCYAYDDYKGSAEANYWVNSDSDSDPYTSELYTIFASGDNGDAITITDDRCHSGIAHVWKVASAPDACRPARCIRWKNNFSGRYYWDHPSNDKDSWTNDGPIVQGGSVYGTFVIYNKDDR